LEGGAVKGIVEERAVELGEYIVASKTTVRGAAKKFGVSKSTVHKDVAYRLRYIDPQLYRKVKAVLDYNKAQRHIRGGIATKMKYQRQAEMMSLAAAKKRMT
jgi:putative DeoR family transcriptional regulator (stage III sporulation protein D)